MGEVYRATDTTLGRQVARKILPEAVASHPERIARFEREAKTLAALNHPHIAASYDVEKSSGAFARVMELVEGEDPLRQIATGPIPADEALPIQADRQGARGGARSMLFSQVPAYAPRTEHAIVMLQNFADELRRRVPVGKLGQRAVTIA